MKTLTIKNAVLLIIFIISIFGMLLAGKLALIGLLSISAAGVILSGIPFFTGLLDFDFISEVAQTHANIRILKRRKSFKGQALAYMSLGGLYSNLGKHGKAIKKLTKALKIIETQSPGETEVKALIFQLMGTEYLLIGVNESAEKYLLLSLELWEILKDRDSIKDTLDKLAELYKKIENKEKENKINQRLNLFNIYTDE